MGLSGTEMGTWFWLIRIDIPGTQGLVQDGYVMQSPLESFQEVVWWWVRTTSCLFPWFVIQKEYLNLKILPQRGKIHQNMSPETKEDLGKGTMSYWHAWPPGSSWACGLVRLLGILSFANLGVLEKSATTHECPCHKAQKWQKYDEVPVGAALI